MTAVRLMVARSNSKISLYKEEGKKMIAQSKPIDNGQSQLLIAKNLEVNVAYTIVLEFSERMENLDGQSTGGCESFIFSFKTWDSNNVCSNQQPSSQSNILTTTPEGEEQTSLIQMNSKIDKK